MSDTMSIRERQEWLNLRGFGCVIDGIDGPATQRALKKFNAKIGGDLDASLSPTSSLLEEVDDGWVVTKACRFLTPNRYHATCKSRLVRPPEAVVMHYTASSKFRGTVRWLTDPTARVSAHFVIARSGDVAQLAPLADRCWHAGGRSSRLRGERNVNGRTFGIELMNLGNASGQWQPFTIKQIAATYQVVEALARHFPQLRQASAFVGHRDVDPSRKIDPGPLFPWTIIRKAVDAT